MDIDTAQMWYPLCLVLPCMHVMLDVAGVQVL